ncbi:MAG: circularly permuted type 2 ATP-grasp protein [Acidimicrobiia bacterium]|nr:circularly permuted type 2 ATP-grasp protein [Acidimicrobiia bacterium]
MDWDHYDPTVTYDEFLTTEGTPRQALSGVADFLGTLDANELLRRQEAAEAAMAAMGITFTVYDENSNIDRTWPFDVVPRVIPAAEWRQVRRGLEQRLAALNHFIDDIYGDGKILADKVVPRELIEGSPNFRAECVGAEPAFGVWAHICGSDLVRDADGTMYVLEDNLRVPSGVSYMLENRLVTKRVFPELFRNLDIQPVDDYPSRLFDLLASLSAHPDDTVTAAVLTPGVYNSAYFEHAFLAQQMGVELVEGPDLFVEDDTLFMRTIHGPAKVDVLYRRVDDLFIDPDVFVPESVLGVRGLMRAWRAGNVAIANAPGAGVADDKVVYTYVPDMIRYYLGEEPLVPNVPTFRCDEPAELSHVLANLGDLVVKPANESGGYGVFVGPASTVAEQEEVAAKIKEDPRNWIGQPTLALSTAPTLCDGRLEPRHIDLRPFILTGNDSYVTHGGLTRVALREGSLVVNSSQGGGSKDTWILEEDA